MQQARKSVFDKGADNILVGKTYEQLLGQAKIKEEEEEEKNLYLKLFSF